MPTFKKTDVLLCRPLNLDLGITGKELSEDLESKPQIEEINNGFLSFFFSNSALRWRADESNRAKFMAYNGIWKFVAVVYSEIKIEWSGSDTKVKGMVKINPLFVFALLAPVLMHFMIAPINTSLFFVLSSIILGWTVLLLYMVSMVKRLESDLRNRVEKLQSE